MKGQYVSNLTLVRLGLCGVVILYSFWISTNAAHAKTVLFADPFDGQLGTNWLLVQDRQMIDAQRPCMNRFTPASWILEQGKLQLEIDGPSCMMDLGPSNVELRGLSQFSLSWKMKLKDSTLMDRSVVFLWMDSRNWYGLKLFGNTILIEKVVNGVAYPLEKSETQFPFQANREYQLLVDVNRDQHMAVWVDQQQVLDVLDQGPYIAPRDRQYFTLRGAVGAVQRSVTIIDDVILESNQVTPTLLNLNVPLLKQTDPIWKNMEYDTAHLWSSIPTMNRWGCAVTSMAMILQYHGISQLPSGEQLTPQSLNAWLKAQADGYFSGNINWLAVSRLSQQVSTKLGTPKLEFSRTDGTFSQINAFALQELNANKPVILGYPGHFFVADGIDKVNNTLLTKDPFYSYKKLNLRPTAQEVNTIRRFQPSHTDLSYILLNSSPGLELSVKDQTGSVVLLEEVSEYLKDPTGETTETSPLSTQHLIRKPETGVYKVNVSQAVAGPYTLDSFTYDVAGGVEGNHYQGTVDNGGKEISLEFRKEAPTNQAPTNQAPTNPSPTSSPLPSAAPTSPIPSVSPNSQQRRRTSLNAKILEEVRRIELLLRVLRSYRFFIQRTTYQHFFLQRLESLKEQTNWRDN